MKKRDGRTLDRKTMEVIRRDAVERARAGESISTVMASYRMARTTFYKWMARMEAGDGTVRSLRARKARGRASLLSAEQKQAVRRDESLPERAARDLTAMKHRPRLIRSFFEQPDTVYIHNVA